MINESNHFNPQWNSQKLNPLKLDHLQQKVITPKGEIKLRSKLWQVMLCLYQNRGKLTPRDALIETIWSGNFLTGPQGLNHCVCHLRRIFGRMGVNIKIITIPKRGYILHELEIMKEHQLTVYPNYFACEQLILTCSSQMKVRQASLSTSDQLTAQKR